MRRVVVAALAVAMAAGACICDRANFDPKGCFAFGVCGELARMADTDGGPE